MLLQLHCMKYKHGIDIQDYQKNIISSKFRISIMPSPSTSLTQWCLTSMSFLPILSEYLNFSQIPSFFFHNSFFQIISIFFILMDYSFDASGLFEIFSNFFRCFQRHRQESSQFFQIFQFYSDLYRFFQMPADSSRFFQFFQILLNFSKFFEILQNSLRLSQVSSDSFQFFTDLSISFRFPQILSYSLKLLQILPESPNFS